MLLVERLRQKPPDYGPLSTSHRLRNEAADMIEKLRGALLWIDNADPETVAAAEAKFDFKLLEI